MNKSILSAFLLALAFGSSLTVACGGGDDNSGGTGAAACQGPAGTGTASTACKSCIEDSCSSSFSAFCSGNCAKDSSSSSCQKATQDISSCVVAHCLAQCDDSSASSGGSGSDTTFPGSGGAHDTPAGGAPAIGTPTTASCKELATCCATLPEQAQAPCLEAAGYDNDAPCLSLLNSYHNGGLCMGGSGGGQSTLACYIEAEGTCTKTPVPDSVKDAYVSSCTDAGGVAGEACPAKDLVGCCTLQGGVETCAYPGGQGGLDADSCSQAGGTWSETP